MIAALAPALAGSPLPSEVIAWDVYRAHATDCGECRWRLHNCEAGRTLWEAYRAARGPILIPIPGGQR